MLADVALFLLNSFLSLILHCKILGAGDTLLPSGCTMVIATNLNIFVCEIKLKIMYCKSLCLVDLGCWVLVRGSDVSEVFWGMKSFYEIWRRWDKLMAEKSTEHYQICIYYIWGSACTENYWVLQVCIIYALTVTLFLATTFVGCWRWDTGNAGLTSTPVLILPCFWKL